MDDETEEVFWTQCQNERCKYAIENLKEFTRRRKEYVQQHHEDKLENERLSKIIIELEKQVKEYDEKLGAAVNGKEIAEAEFERTQSESKMLKERLEDALKRAAASDEHLKGANEWRTKFEEMSQLAEQLEAKLDDVQDHYVKAVSLLDQSQKKFTTMKGKVEMEKTKNAPLVTRLNTLDKYLKKAITVIDTLSCSTTKMSKPTKDLVLLFRRDDVRVQFNAEPFRRSAVSSSTAEMTELGLEMSEDEEQEGEDDDDDVGNDLIEEVEKILGNKTEKRTTEKKERVKKFVPVENISSWSKGMRKPLPGELDSCPKRKGFANSAESMKGTPQDKGLFNPRRVHSVAIPAPFKKYQNDFEAVNKAASQRTQALLDRAAGPSSSSNTVPEFVEPAAATIHGRKGKSVREQQTENMKKMSVKERAEKMKADEKYKSNSSSTSKPQPRIEQQVTPLRKSPRTRNSTLSENSIEDETFTDIQVQLKDSDDAQPSVPGAAKRGRPRSSSVLPDVSSTRRSRSSTRNQELSKRSRSQSVVKGETSRIGRPRGRSLSTMSRKSDATTDERPRRTSERLSKIRDCVEEPVEQRRSQRLAKPTENNDDVEMEKATARSRLRSFPSTPMTPKKSKVIQVESRKSQTPMVLKRSARLSNASKEEEQTEPEVPVKIVQKEKNRRGAHLRKDVAKVVDNDGPPTRVRSMPVKPTLRKKTGDNLTCPVPIRRSTRLNSVEEPECGIVGASEVELSEVGPSEEVVTEKESVPELSQGFSESEEDEDGQLRIDEPIEDVAEVTAENIFEVTAENLAEVTVENIPEVTAENISQVTAENIFEVTAENTSEVTAENIAEVSVQVLDEMLSETVKSTEIVAIERTSSEIASETVEPRNLIRNKYTVPPVLPFAKKEKTLDKSENAKTSVGRREIQLLTKLPIPKTKKDYAPKVVESSSMDKNERVDLPTNLEIANGTEDDDEDELRIDEPENEPITSTGPIEKMPEMIQRPSTSSFNAAELVDKLLDRTMKTSKPKIKTTAKHVELGLDISDSEDEDDTAQPEVKTTTKPNNQKRTAILIDVPVKKSGRGIKRANEETIRLNATKRSKLSKSSDGSTVLRQALDLKLPPEELSRALEERGFKLVNNQIPIDCNDAVDVMIEFLKTNSNSDMWSVLLRQTNAGNSNRLVNTDEETFLNVSVSLVADDQMVLRLFIERVLSEFASHDSSMSSTLCGCLTRLFCDAVRFVQTESEEEKSEWMSKLIHIMLLRHENQAVRTLAYCLVSSSAQYLEWISDEISNDTFFSKVLRIVIHRDKQSAEVVNRLISAKLRNCPMILDVEEKDVHEVTIKMFDEFLRLEIEKDEHEMAHVRDSVMAFKTLTELIKTEHHVILQTTFTKMRELMEELEDKLLDDESGKKKPFMFFGQISDDKISASQASEMFLKFEWISKALLIFISNSSTSNCRAVMNSFVEISPKIVKFKQVLSSDSQEKVDPSGHSILLQAIQKMSSLIAEFTRYPLEKTVIPQNL